MSDTFKPFPRGGNIIFISALFGDCLHTPCRVQLSILVALLNQSGALNLRSRSRHGCLDWCETRPACEGFLKIPDDSNMQPRLRATAVGNVL